MALCVCKCLNVTLESDLFEDFLDIGKLELTSVEQRDTFFSEKLLCCPANKLKTQTVLSVLVGERSVGRWILYTCLTCGQTTHAILQDRNAPVNSLIAKSTQTTQEHIDSLKKSNNYSPVFNLLIPEVSNDIVMKENIDTNKFFTREKRGWPLTYQVMGTLNEQLNQTLQSQLEAVEESVRQYRDQKYAEFEAFKERAQREHLILASIINKARNNADNDSCRDDPSLDNGPPSPQLPPLQRRRLSSIKDAKKAHNLTKPIRTQQAEEDSLEAEELFFDLEDTNSRHNMISDHEDYDDSDQESDDAGVAIGRPRGGGSSSVARSLPMTMPNFPGDRSSDRYFDDDEEPATDIPASIKALARSVHGDVFELPRPRFSTQI